MVQEAMFLTIYSSPRGITTLICSAVTQINWLRHRTSLLLRMAAWDTCANAQYFCVVVTSLDGHVAYQVPAVGGACRQTSTQVISSKEGGGGDDR